MAVHLLLHGGPVARRVVRITRQRLAPDATYLFDQERNAASWVPGRLDTHRADFTEEGV